MTDQGAKIVKLVVRQVVHHLLGGSTVKSARFVGVASIMIIGVGTDLVCIDRIDRVLARHPDRFVGRILTLPSEPGLMHSKSDLAGAPMSQSNLLLRRLLSKALGTGMRAGVQFNRIEVLRNGVGQPSVTLLHEAALKAARLGC